MKTSLSVIAFVTACGQLTCDVFASNYKFAFIIKNASPLPLLTTNKSNYSYLLHKVMTIKSQLPITRGKRGSRCSWQALDSVPRQTRSERWLLKRLTPWEASYGWKPSCSRRRTSTGMDRSISKQQRLWDCKACGCGPIASAPLMETQKRSTGVSLRANLDPGCWKKVNK